MKKTVKGRLQNMMLRSFKMDIWMPYVASIKSALANFEKILEGYPDNCDALKLGQAEKAHEFIKKATTIDPRDPQAFLDLGELLIFTDAAAALDAFKTARNLLQNRKDEKKDKDERHKDEDKEVPIELLNNIGVLYFERENLSQSAAKSIETIYEQQLDSGTEDFKVVIIPTEWDFRASS